MDFFEGKNLGWYSVRLIKNKSFICGYCSDKIATDRGYQLGMNVDGSGNQIGGIYICPNCHGPNFLSPSQAWFPGQKIGRSVRNVPEELNNLYEEARRCAKENCFTATVLICRKMLMNISVQQGAKENLSFIKYVNFLSENGYVPPNGKGWVDHIRKKGNEATHEIVAMEMGDAKDLLFFTEMLLIFLYEFPSMIPKSDEEFQQG